MDLPRKPETTDRMRIEYLPLEEVARWPRNPKLHADEVLDESLERFGFVAPAIRDEITKRLVAGHGRLDRLLARKAAGLAPPKRIELREVDGVWLMPVVCGVAFESEEEAEAYLVADNRIVELGGWSRELPAMLERMKLRPASLYGVGFTGADIEALKARLALPAAPPAPGPKTPPVLGTLQKRFLVPPFTVLDARQAYWTQRKALWRELGFDGARGRGLAQTWGNQEGTDLVTQKIVAAGARVSAFDPVLCEIVYRWFAAPGSTVIDPFAGGCTSGIVAGVLGRHFTGIELRDEQVRANREQAAALALPAAPRWLQGSSAKLSSVLDETEAFDLLFTDPPYFTLERYSDDESDASTIRSYDDFIALVGTVLTQAVTRLREDRFAVLKIGEVRGKDGGYVGFVPDCINIMRRAGLVYVNEAILVTPIGSLPVRTAGAFGARRTMGKTHQNVLVFCKGDAKRAAQFVGPVEIAMETPGGALSLPRPGAASAARGGLASPVDTAGFDDQGLDLVSDEPVLEASDHGAGQNPVKGDRRGR
jgi:DNA modification methylase